MKSEKSTYYKEAYRQKEAESKKRQSNQQSDASKGDEVESRIHPNGVCQGGEHYARYAGIGSSVAAVEAVSHDIWR